MRVQGRISMRQEVIHLLATCYITPAHFTLIQFTHLSLHLSMPQWIFLWSVFRKMLPYNYKEKNKRATKHSLRIPWAQKKNETIHLDGFNTIWRKCSDFSIVWNAHSPSAEATWRGKNFLPDPWLSCKTQDCSSSHSLQAAELKQGRVELLAEALQKLCKCRRLIN